MKNLLKIKAIIMVTFLSINSYAQTNFIKFGNGPVLTRNTTFGVWDAIAVSDPNVFLINDTLRMWYTGVGWLSTSDTSVHQRIGYAWSLDGISWNQYVNNPVLDKTDNSWDNKGVETPTILIDYTAPSNERYKMWYAGQNTITDIYEIGYAYSPDGFNWTKSSQNPVVLLGSSSSWENGYLEGPSVLLVDDTLRMWYASVDLTGDGQPTDFTGNIGYAWSLDGINWTKHPNNPIFTSYNSPSWDQSSVADPHVIYNDNKYHMFYAGLNDWTYENFKMGYAVSNDGINWTRPTSSPILETGNTGEWDDEDASYGCAIYNPTLNKYQMWYTGLDTNMLSSNLNGYYYDIGYATSDNVLGLMNNNNTTEDLNFYPNPCNNSLTIKFEKEVEINNIQIYNLMGEQVTIPYSVSETSFHLNTLNLKSGIYLLKINLNTNEISTIKFIKKD